MRFVVRSVLAASIVGAMPGVASAQTAPAAQPAPSPSTLVHLQPDPSDAVKLYVVDPASSTMSRDDLVAALRKKVRYPPRRRSRLEERRKGW